MTGKGRTDVLPFALFERLEQAVFRERAAGVNLLELEAEMQVNRHILP